MNEITSADTTPTPAAPLNGGVSRILIAQKRWLNVPIKNDAPLRTMTLSADGIVLHRFEIPLAEDAPDWWAFLEVGDQKGKSLTITADALPENSSALNAITNTDEITGAETLYREPLRPQFHFSAKRGWLNDPNGLVYYNGEYHLFFQHCPFRWGDGVKYWGHAVSRDLVHWTEVEEALSPDEHGPMWSGSAVVDKTNVSGFGKNGKPPLVLIYTAAGAPFVQCIAYSTDGRHFTKFAGNPVVGNITAGNRDPRVFWHEPTRRWVQALYVEEDKKHTVHFLTSPNLREWIPASVASGQPGTNFIYECPDIFPLPLDGDTKKTKWILTGADSQYQVGGFDGATFTPETAVLPGHRGKGFYAPQTFNDEPKNRRIQIGWRQTETRAMPFNQSMSLSLELNLISTPDGPRMTWNPVKELESLRAKAHLLGAITVRAGNSPNPLSAIQSELVEIRAAFTPGEAQEITFTVRGVSIAFDVKKQEIVVNNHRAPAPLRDGKQRLTIYADRNGLEVFAGDGLTFLPMPVNLKPEDTNVSISVRGVSVAFDRLDVYELRSAWR